MNKIIVELFFLLHVDMNKLKVIVINSKQWTLIYTKAVIFLQCILGHHNYM